MRTVRRPVPTEDGEAAFPIVNVSEMARVCDLSRTTIYKYIEILERHENREPTMVPCWCVIEEVQL